MTSRTAAVSSGATIHLPDAPPIPGLQFRLYRGPDDNPAMARVANAQSAAIGESRVMTVAELDNDHGNPVNMDPYRDIFLAEVDGAIVGWGRVDWVDQNWGGRSFSCQGAIDPAWWRHGIGRALLRQNQRRLLEIAAEQGYTGPGWFTAWGSDASAGLLALMEQEGFTVVRHFYLMERPNLDDIPLVSLPDGFEIRPVHEAQLRQLFSADVDAFQDHWGAALDTDENFMQWVGRPEFNPSMFVIAWDGDEIAGGVINGIFTAENERLGVKRGFLESVFTRRPWRRRGLARALISRSLALHAERGMASAALGVDASNPSAALPLYESCGFVATEKDSAYRKPLDPAKGREWEALHEPAL